MKLLLDTQVLLWAIFEQAKVPPRMRSAIEETANTVYFSVTAVWETSIKHATGRKDFTYDPRLLRRHAISAGYIELAITGDHTLQIGTLPALHRDPFDRILIAQAQFEDYVLLTADWLVRQYPSVAFL